MEHGAVTLFLCGDVMPGRGVDQILAHPGDPRLRERYVRDARTYVDLAEAVSGPIPRPVGFAWPWGSALGEFDDAAPDARVVNLETSITRSDTFAPGKAMHYRMNPDNVPFLAAGRPDVCVLANNHVLDFGEPGLHDTLDALSRAGLRTVGAGRDACEAARPATVNVDGARVVVFAYGADTSGVPPMWAAGPGQSGVGFLPDLSEATAEEVLAQVRKAKRPGDVVVVSVHWGSNWGYGVPDEQVHFAHRLLDGGVDVLHGHSSHHPRPIERYRGKLVLYGCGDLIDDYEGISGHEEYRNDLRLLYFASVDPCTGTLVGLRMVPVQAHRMSLRRAAVTDAGWLRATLDDISSPFGPRFVLDSGGAVVLRGGSRETGDQ